MVFGILAVNKTVNGGGESVVGKADNCPGPTDPLTELLWLHGYWKLIIDNGEWKMGNRKSVGVLA